MTVKKTRRPGEAISWLWAGLWLLFVYISIPLARTVQEFMQGRGWRDLFLWVTLASFGLAAGWIARGFFSGRFRFTVPRFVAARDEPYISEVSAHLITRVSQELLTGLFGGLFLLAIAGERWIARRWRDEV